MKHTKWLAIAFLLLLFNFTFSYSSPDFLSSLFGYEESEEFYKILPIKADGVFSLRNVNGSITISTWKKEEVEIKAEKTVKDNGERLDEIKIEIESTPDFVSVDTIYPRWKNIQAKVIYEIKVPEGLNLKNIRTVNGSVYMSGPFSNVSASTTNGSVDLDNATGEVDISTTNGQIETHNITGALEASTTNGSIELDVTSFEEEIAAETVNGSITLRIGKTENIHADLTVKTVNGKIYMDFPVTFKSISKSKHSLEGQIGEGGSRIHLRTVNGSIKLTK